MLRATAVAALLLFGAGSVRAEAPDPRQCRNLFTSPTFDCGCVAGFMQERFGTVEQEIIMTFWAVTVDKVRYRQSLLEDLYQRHGSPTITEALFRFNLLHDRLFAKCPSSRPDDEYGF